MSEEYLDKIERAINKPSQFRFKVGQPVHHKLFLINGNVARRMYIEDVSQVQTAYDIGVPDGETRVMCEIDEGWLGDGYLKR